jgi:serine phosphatase RsbU (regulator of sigma subunit)
MLISMQKSSVMRERGIPLRQDDRYVLYTDGLLESTNAKGEEFGLPRCKQSLESHFRLAAAALADELLSEIAQWSARSSGRAQEDDMTLIIFAAKGNPELATELSNQVLAV